MPIKDKGQDTVMPKYMATVVYYSHKIKLKIIKNIRVN
jgi:hypothetical protein